MTHNCEQADRGTLTSQIACWKLFVAGLPGWDATIEEYNNDVDTRAIIQDELDAGARLSASTRIDLVSADREFIRMSVPRIPPRSINSRYDFWALMIPRTVADRAREDLALTAAVLGDLSAAEMARRRGCIPHDAATIELDVLRPAREAKEDTYFRRWIASEDRAPLYSVGSAAARAVAAGTVISAYITVPMADGTILGCQMSGVLEPEADALVTAGAAVDPGIDARGRLSGAFAVTRTALLRADGLATGEEGVRWKPVMPGVVLP